ncbi:hypothetical protein B0T26DRAFT_672570 [Lasiosphaeria miniovina]|uniref:Uncharacterized protein n=1 Tax=Lasiosphaeria miniovina TaxID=1954250 RepID=A0AA40E8J7_9PEZI|nr:uncharacterized protein B0T26DRAFT_672570 [Lasiosphaeria miniovina]KAK0727971.1 hypothetical protein B0T26DRAFT_672570 [Lasiosphaeria miniovina]
MSQNKTSPADSGSQGRSRSASTVGLEDKANFITEIEKRKSTAKSGDLSDYEAILKYYKQADASIPHGNNFVWSINGRVGFGPVDEYYYEVALKEKKWGVRDSKNFDKAPEITEFAQIAVLQQRVARAPYHEVVNDTCCTIQTIWQADWNHINQGANQVPSVSHSMDAAANVNQIQEIIAEIRVLAPTGNATNPFKLISDWTPERFCIKAPAGNLPLLSGNGIRRHIFFATALYTHSTSLYMAQKKNGINY